MQIKFHGHSCFSITEGPLTIVTDPYPESVGVLSPLKANAVTVSRAAYTHLTSIQGEPKVFNWPGEYEMSDVHFYGIPSFHNSKDSKEQEENTIFKMEISGISLCHLGGLGTRLTSEQLEAVGDVDILFLPVGGSQSIDAKKAKEVIEQIEPRIIIPMMYKMEGLKFEAAPLEPFLAEMGAQNAERLEVLNVRRSDMPEESSKVVVLNKI